MTTLLRFLLATLAVLTAWPSTGSAQTKLKWAHVYEVAEPYHAAIAASVSLRPKPRSHRGWIPPTETLSLSPMAENQPHGFCFAASSPDPSADPTRRAATRRRWVAPAGGRA